MAWILKKLSLKSVEAAGGEGDDACLHLRSTLCQKKPKHNRTKRKLKKHVSKKKKATKHTHERY